MKLKAAIFDLDGTLLDSMHIWLWVGEAYLKSRGLLAQKNLREIVKDKSLHQSAEYFKETYGLADSVEQIMDGVNQLIEQQYFETLTLKPGAEELLEALQQKGVKMCIATATDRHLVEAALKREGVLNLFDSIYTCSEVGAGKDQPDIYLQAWQGLNVEKEAVIIFEDALYAVETAKKAGFRVAAVKDFSAEGDTAEIMGIADYYLNSLEDWKIK